jgi:hypothetical protein
MNFRFSRAPQGPLAHAGTRGIPSDGRCRAGPVICLGRAGDACVVGALKRVGDTLYGARVYVKLGRRLAHAHAARQSCSDSLSQLVRDRRPAKSFTFTLGPLKLSIRQIRPSSKIATRTIDRLRAVAKRPERGRRWPVLPI